MKNGLHWSNNDSDHAITMGLLQQLTGFDSALVLAIDKVERNGLLINPNKWKRICKLLKTNLPLNGEIIIRLYLPSDNALWMQGDPAKEIAEQFYFNIIKPAFLEFGITKFQVLNEINLEYEFSKPRSELAGDMYNLGYWLRYYERTDLLTNKIELLFPAPGGDTGNPKESDWNHYWKSYELAMQTWYDGIGLHSYEYSTANLYKLIMAQCDYLAKYDLPIYVTEYGVPIGSYGKNYQNRANDLATMINSVEMSNKVKSMYYFIASAEKWWKDFCLVDEDALDFKPSMTLAKALK